MGYFRKRLINEGEGICTKRWGNMKKPINETHRLIYREMKVYNINNFVESRKQKRPNK